MSKRSLKEILDAYDEHFCGNVNDFEVKTLMEKLNYPLSDNKMDKLTQKYADENGVMNFQRIRPHLVKYIKKVRESRGKSTTKDNQMERSRSNTSRASRSRSNVSRSQPETDMQTYADATQSHGRKHSQKRSSKREHTQQHSIVPRSHSKRRDASLQRHRKHAEEQFELDEEDEDVAIAEAFKKFDRDNDGVISPKEIMIAFRDLGDNLTQEELASIMYAIDTNNDGVINYEEFVEMWRNRSQHMM